MVGELAGEDVVDAAGELLGDAMEAVEISDAAMVKRMCDSVLSVAVVTHAVGFISSCCCTMAKARLGYTYQGSPLCGTTPLPRQ